MLFNPLSAALVIVVVLLLLWMLTRRGAFLVASVVIIALLWLLATPWMSRTLQSLLESEASELPAQALPKADAIVVLGGVLSPPVLPESDANLSAAADRLVYAARLYTLGKAPVILVSGGHGGTAGAMKAESVHAAALLTEWGVPASAVFTETESINTYENAVYSKLMLDQHGLKRVLLVTSAVHMPRALATFKSAGIDAIPAATDFVTALPAPSGLDAWIANPASLDSSTQALKEYVGWIVYRQRGWISG
ncbi:MAG: YdcF family protein [Planctomycetota bacterium]|jgi:uncharacterized SAM-binding protein YcdF (DUF218 family)